MKLLKMLPGACMLLSAFAIPAFAAEITVTDPAGLAAAVADASDDDILVLSANTTYTLTDQVVISKAITIRGAGIDSSIVKQTVTNKRIFILDNENARIEGCTITGANVSLEINNSGNKSQCDGHSWGIAVTITEKGGTLYNCRVTGNRVGCNHNRCVGVYSMDSKGVISHCRIDDNKINGGTSGTYGGVRLAGGTMEYCLVKGNKGHQSGGIGVEGACTVNNCVVYGNETTANGGGNLNVGSASAVFTDCIFAGGICPITSTDTGRPEWCGSLKATFTRCAFPLGVTLGTWNGSAFNADPLFLDLADFPSRLASPLTADIGWKPVDRTKPGCDFTLSEARVLQNAEVKLTSYVSGIDSPAYAWKIVDPAGNETVSSDANPTVKASQTGTYTISLSVSGTAAPYAQTFGVVAQKVYPATAAELMSAVATATDGQEIILDSKTYEITHPLEIAAAVTVKGQGRDKTIVQQKTKTTRVFDINHADAVVDGMTLKGVTFSYEWSHGCVVRILTGGGTVKNCTLTGAYCPNNWTYGIGIAMYAGTLDHCIVSNNTINAAARNGNYGGGVYVSKGTVSNCLICDNSAQYGGGIYVDGADVRVENCTIAKNSVISTTSPSGGGLYTTKAATFVNNIVALNENTSSSATATTKEFNASADATYTTCLFASGVSSTRIKGTSIFKDPAFVNVAARDFHEEGGSPSVNAGTDYEGLAEKDLSDFTRKSGSHVDIGCYEFDSDQMTVSFSASEKEGFPAASVSFVATATGVAEGTPVTCAWTVTGPDGVERPQAETGLTLTIEPTDAGMYTVSVVATAGSVSTPKYVSPDCYYVCPQKMYVKEATAENIAKAKFPYATEETAATSLFDAVTNAISGVDIELMDGEHLIAKRLDVSKPLTIHGQGWKKTTIRQTAKTVSVLYLNDAAAVVRGVTLTGLRAEGEIHSRGAVIIDSMGGTVEDCRITGNRYNASQYGINHARGVGITLNGAAAVCRRCIIDRNIGSLNGVNNDRGGGVQGIAGLLENCLVCMNTNKHAGGIYIDGNFTVRNCTVYGNVGTGTDSDTHGHNGVGGLGVGSGTSLIENTIFAANESPNQTWETGGYPDIRRSSGSVTFKNCCLTNGIAWPATATACVNGDPKFVDAANGDWHLRVSSPCCGKGDNSAVSEGAVDLDGNPRKFGRNVDIGCYECQKSVGFHILVR